MKKYCDKCNEKIGFSTVLTKKNLEFEDNTGRRLFLCLNCYLDSSKEYKKKLKYISQQELLFKRGGTIRGVRPDSAKGQTIHLFNESFMYRIKKKYNVSEEDLNSYSLHHFNLHFWCLDPFRIQALMDMMEGETDSRHYKKHILNKRI